MISPNQLTPELDTIIRDTAEKYDISILQAREIIYLTFKYLHDTISSAEKDNLPTFKSFRIIHFGLFRINKRFFRSLSKYKKLDLTLINKENDKNKLSTTRRTSANKST